MNPRAMAARSDVVTTEADTQATHDEPVTIAKQLNMTPIGEAF
jgi:hypothetical protein